MMKLYGFGGIMVPLFLLLQLFGVNMLPYLTSDFTLPEPQSLSNAMTLWATWYYLPQQIIKIPTMIN